ncbi:tRNA (adenosine(37)-N6)-dimethylallyltransferase MiaA [Apilactobacillus apisilvae]|uniref:tRNA dimethylallyltransferase n=1 Tax=Apilactobacillus apisilvae TaxID=2923364 RepID=A0ABY4PIH6_9LACO|nr:tRNA (adenosine(37)-N6)-dimethylallyltransferase MiaA [Apilactobacillus apisilvae]UQS85305.1 tRNA (adenosine(37)-N6)-dimethylallyltransferase MiaA [Apilactobacillus apisilvae]
MNKVLIIAGPTAIGKTSLSISLAKKFDGEIISGDSMQVYRHLSIGTAKVTSNEMDGVKHHLINFKDVNERYSASNFVDDAKNLIKDISSRGKLPIIVGGTGFYLQSLVDGFKFGQSFDKDNKLRNDLHKYSIDNGKYNLWKRLDKVDHESAINIPVNNERRIIRSLEFYKQSGNKFSEQNDKSDIEIDSYIIALNTNRNNLYQRINKRVDDMFSSGLVDEAKWLYNKGGLDLPACKGIGYKEFDGYFNGNLNLNDVKDLIQKNSRHYAKRQLTWFRNKMDVTWYDILNNKEEIYSIEQDITKWINK